MVRFPRELNISLHIVLFISCCCPKSTSLNLQSNRRVVPHSIESNINGNLVTAPVNKIQEIRLQALTLSIDDDIERLDQIARDYVSYRVATTATESTGALSTVLSPSMPVIPTEHTAEMTNVEKLRMATFLGIAANTFLAVVLKSAPGSWRFFLAGKKNSVFPLGFK